jgi:hypothetical protein
MLGRIVEKQVAKLDFDSTDEKVAPVDRHIPEVVHTWSQPCHLPFERWSVRLVLKPEVWVRVSKGEMCRDRKNSQLLTRVVGVAFEVRWVAYRPRLVALISSELGGLAFKEKDAKGKCKETVEVGAPSPSIIKLDCFLVACCVL